MSVIAATHTVVNSKPRNLRHRFGQGILAWLPTARVEATQADLAWAAQHLNQDTADYDLDTQAEAFECQARYDAGFVPC